MRPWLVRVRSAECEWLVRDSSHANDQLEQRRVRLPCSRRRAHHPAAGMQAAASPSARPCKARPRCRRDSAASATNPKCPRSVLISAARPCYRTSPHSRPRNDGCLDALSLYRNKPAAHASVLPRRQTQHRMKTNQEASPQDSGVAQFLAQLDLVAQEELDGLDQPAVGRRELGERWLALEQVEDLLFGGGHRSFSGSGCRGVSD